ncbi:ATP-grasp domain-containing protein [Gilvimarinus sp. F26214L]|uniref:ATP-grasp domain-containing protein n=1 Tax=Gilvimarinus sp. DZF01 TaxID=3461371 RepID=UPI0040453D71
MAATEPKNIFVLGYDEQHERDLQALPDRERFRFHPLLHSSELVYQENFDIEAKLDKAGATLAGYTGEVHGIICHWDFPVNPMAAILAAEFGLRYPTLESILKCSHKYWSRLEQQKVAPEVTPAFCAVDPFADNPLDQVTLDFPFWLKPVKGYNSLLGFRVDNAEEFERAIGIARDRIGRIGNEFNTMLDRVTLPPDLNGVNGNYLMAEELIYGHEFAPEGYVQNGECHVHGMFDMVQAENGKSFQRYEYPSRAPASVQERAVDVAKRVMKQVGFDNGCFNIEYFWDPDTDRLSLVEVNPRMSQSHSYQFEQVDGMSNHEVAVHVALGDKPLFEHGSGRFEHAAKFLLRRYDLTDGIAIQVPSDEDLERLRREQPDTQVHLNIHRGDRLSRLVDQDAYSYVLAEVLVAGHTVAEMEQKYRRAVDMLPFRFDPIKAA